MIKQTYANKYLLLALTFLLLFCSMIQEPIQLNIPPDDSHGAIHLFCAPSPIQETARFFVNRMSGISLEFVETARIRPSRCREQRFTYFFALLDAVIALILISGSFFSRYAKHIRNILSRSLLIVKFLHKADGKLEAISLI